MPDLSEVLVYHKRNASATAVTITPDTIQSSQTILDTDITKSSRYESNLTDVGQCGYSHMGGSGIDSIGEDRDNYSGTPETETRNYEQRPTMDNRRFVGQKGVTNGSRRLPLSRLSRNAPVVLSQDEDTFVGDSQGF